MTIWQIIIPAALVLGGIALGIFIAFHYWRSHFLEKSATASPEEVARIKAEIELGNDMMVSIRSLREDVLRAYENIEAVERTNHDLKMENIQLKYEKEQSDRQLADVRNQLAHASQEIVRLEGMVQQYIRECKQLLPGAPPPRNPF